MKELEMKLRSWQPRRPSAMLRFKLAVAAGNFLPRAARFASWLVPATACLVLAMLNLRSENYTSVSRPPMTAMILSNQNYAAYWQGFDQHLENSPSAHIFRWTNDSASMSNMRFTSFGK